MSVYIDGCSIPTDVSQSKTLLILSGTVVTTMDSFSCYQITGCLKRLGSSNWAHWQFFLSSDIYIFLNKILVLHSYCLNFQRKKRSVFFFFGQDLICLLLAISGICDMVCFPPSGVAGLRAVVLP